jgi:hypothetical protein
VTIPWAKLSSDPSAWIGEECFPSGFQWADPSKIRIVQVFQLLDHWRQRKNDGLTPLIWNPSCELLLNVEERPQHVRNSQQRQSGQSRSNEREFHDSSSGSDTEEEDFGSELGRISHATPESQSPSPSPSPHQTRRGTGASISRLLTPVSTELPEVHAPPSFRAESCKCYNSIHMFIVLVCGM